MQPRTHFPHVRLAIAVLTSALVIAVVPTIAASQGGTPVASADLEWVSEDPATASTRMSRLAFPDGADTVLIARDDNFADALAGGPLQADGPMLLVDGQAASLAASVVDELRRLAPEEALILGGEAAVGPDVEEELTQLGITPRRFAGAGRIQTADDIAREAADRVTPDAVVLVRAGGPGSAGFADSLSAGALAAEHNLPILLTDTRNLADSSGDVLTDILSPGDTVYLIGGEAAISADVHEQVSALGFRPVRVAGEGRSETAAEVQDLREELGGGGSSDDAVVINGSRDNSWVAGFSTAAFAGRNGAPVFLTSTAGLGADESLIDSRSPSRIVCANNAPACAAAVELGSVTEATAPGLSTDGEASAGQAIEVTMPPGASGATAEGDCLDRPTAVPLTGREGQVTLSPTLVNGPCSLAIRFSEDGQEITAIVTLEIGPGAGPAGIPVAGVADYATHVIGDPWDYSNVEDIILEPNITIGIENPRLEDGLLKFQVQIGYVHVLWQGFIDAIPIGRDGLANPIDTDIFSEVVARVHIPVAGQITLSQQQCDDPPGQCSTLDAQVVQPGWSIVRFPLQSLDGNIYGLRLGAAIDTQVEMMVDWVRVVTPEQPTPLGPDAGPGPHTIQPVNPGVEGLTPSVADGQLRSNGAPAGTFTLQAADGTSQPLIVAEPPRLRFLNPDETGGEDYITAATGDPWDFDQASDALQVGNSRDITFANGELRATNTSNDPFVSMRLGPQPFDPNRYHRVTITYGNEGRWGLEDAPGGGTHGRLIWGRNGDFDNSAEMVTYPPYRTYTFSMSHPDALEEADPGAVWFGAPMDVMRIEPNEDPGARQWFVSDLAIRADDESSGQFTVELGEVAPSHGEDEIPVTATVRLDSDRVGGDGTIVAQDVALTPGTTSLPIYTCPLPGGTYWAHVTATRGPATYMAYSSGPLQVTNTAC